MGIAVRAVWRFFRHTFAHAGIAFFSLHTFLLVFSVFNHTIGSSNYSTAVLHLIFTGLVCVSLICGRMVFPFSIRSFGDRERVVLLFFATEILYGFFCDVFLAFVFGDEIFLSYELLTMKNTIAVGIASWILSFCFSLIFCFFLKGRILNLPTVNRIFGIFGLLTGIFSFLALFFIIFCFIVIASSGQL